MKVLLTLIIGFVVLLALGLVYVKWTDNQATITIETQKIEQDAAKAAHEGKVIVQELDKFSAQNSQQNKTVQPQQPGAKPSTPAGQTTAGHQPAQRAEAP